MSGAAPDPAMRILLMDNTQLFSNALQAKLELDPRFEIVGVATDSAEAVRLAEEVGADIVLLDAETPHGNAGTVTRLLAHNGSTLRVLILADSDFGAVEAHDARAAFLRKPRSAADLVETLEIAALLMSVDVPDQPLDN